MSDSIAMIIHKQGNAATARHRNEIDEMNKDIGDLFEMINEYLYGEMTKQELKDSFQQYCNRPEKAEQ